MGRRIYRRTTLQTAGYGALLGGIGASYWHIRPSPYACWAAFAILLVLLWLGHRSTLVLLLVIFVSLAAGCYRGSLYQRKLDAYRVLYLRPVTLTANAIDDGYYGSKSQLSFEAGDVRLEDGEPLAGKIQLSGFGVNAVFQGDVIRATGKLYPGYGAYQGRISFGKLELMEAQPSFIADLRRRFSAGMQSALPEPAAPFAMGLLFGQRATLPPGIKQNLMMVGLTHIIAVSGYNLTIMLHASKKILGKRSKRIGTWLAIGLIATFLLLTGGSASIVRAAIVSMLSIIAGYYGRAFKPVNLILLAAAITAWANPFYVWSDISWYLSFLAFFGVMVLSPLIAARLHHGWQHTLPMAVALESICAEIMTLPFILHTFGQMSFIGLPANVLVVTLVPLGMLLSLFAGLAGMSGLAVMGWIAWPALVLLTYMLDVARLLAGLPHIFVEQIGLSFVQMLVLYGMIIAMIVLLRGKTNSLKSATITDKKQLISGGDIIERT